MDEHEREPDPKWEPTVSALVEEHIPGEMIVRWTVEAMAEMGVVPPEDWRDIPEEANFRTRQRMLSHLAERASEPLATELRAAHSANAEAGRTLLPGDDEEE